MAFPPVIVFDDGKGLLAPLRDARPVFDVRTGAFTTLERMERTVRAVGAGAEFSVFVPEELAGVARSQHARVNTLEKGAGPVLVLNGRGPVVPEDASRLGEGSALVDTESGDVIAAHLDAADALVLLGGDRPDMEEIGVSGLHLMTRPWHVRSMRDRCLGVDLALLARDVPHEIRDREGVLHIGKEPPRVHGTARVSHGAVFNTESGPVVIDERAVIRPRALITGPAYVGPGSTVLEQANVKAGTAIGPHCKVAGEVSGTIFQGYSNKAHDGFLGDSWVGSWVNIGASTVGSNLLNTYGEVKAEAEPGAGREGTGEQFFGCVLGDHVKTAIGTRIMTGAVVQTGAMWASHEPVKGCVDRFAWVTDDTRERFAWEKFEEVMRAAMGRRKMEPGDALVERLGVL
ncbi:MAG: putative sugar nucleotidyl transferase, partial [Planctomycetota bacterium]